MLLAGDPAQPDFRFCGAKKLLGEGPYCACHAGIAYQTQHNRRRQPRSQSRPSASEAAHHAQAKTNGANVQSPARRIYALRRNVACIDHAARV